jgi:hypothetical protein
MWPKKWRSGRVSGERKTPTVLFWQDSQVNTTGWLTTDGDYIKGWEVDVDMGGKGIGNAYGCLHIALRSRDCFDAEMDKLRKDRCLCLKCTNIDECETAAEFYRVCSRNNVALAVTRCPEWKKAIRIKIMEGL